MVEKIDNLATSKAEVNIVNDGAEYERWIRRAETGISQYDLSKEMKDDYEDDNPLAEHITVYSDLLGWALACVDWMEIAETVITTAKEAEEYYEKTFAVPN